MSAIKCFGEKDMQYLKEVIDSQDLWRGFCSDTSFTSRFEDAYAKHLGRKYVLGVSSGTNAEEVALAAMGLEPGDEVLCPGVAPIFVSMPVVSIGAIPVFVDVEPETMIMDPAKIEERITPKTKAILVVHLHGVPAKMDEILAIAKKHNLMVMEDCAQAYDAYYKGRKTGTMGDVMCASLQQSKHMTSGEGGIFATDDPEMYKRAVLFHNVGMPWYRFGLDAPEAVPFEGVGTRGHFAFGHNYRMSDLQGAIALAQLERIDEYHAARAERVAAIEAELAGAEGIELAHVHDDCQANYWLYPVRMPEGMGGMEINYVEVAFQKMQNDRKTLLGTPLPDYVQYVVGSCPVAEKESTRFTCLGCHPSASVEDCVAAARDLKKQVAEFLAAK
jgi:perosamine synthetase